MHNEYRQVIEQMDVVDAQHHRRAGRRRSQRLNHPAQQLRVSVTPGGAHAVNAPRGIARAAEVPTTHRHSHPFDAATDNASRAIRLLPTPVVPQTTIPEPSGAAMAASIVLISSDRPTNGHDKRTWKAYVRSPQTAGTYRGNSYLIWLGPASFD